MPSKDRREKRPTYTSLVEEAMRQWGEPVAANDLATLLGASKNVVSATLIHLASVGVARRVDGPRTQVWALTGNDLRTAVIEERAVETEPRKRGRTTKQLQQA